MNEKTRSAEDMPKKASPPVLSELHSAISEENNRLSDIATELEHISRQLHVMPEEPIDKSEAEKEPATLVDFFWKQRAIMRRNNDRLEWVIKHLKGIIGS